LKKGINAASEQLQNSVTKQKSKVKAKEGLSLMDRFLAARSQEAMDVYQEVDELVRGELFERFKEANSGIKLHLKKGLENSTVKAMFAPWYANELWGEPTAEALARFLEQSEITKS
jgi:hypothetical protein